MTNQVHVLFTGYAHDDAENADLIRANCTCTLIQTASKCNIIVDTLSAWDATKLIAALCEYQLQPDDIHYVVSTHGHADHIGCNNLFTNARWHVVGSCITNADKYLNYDWGNSSVGFLRNAFKLDGNKDVVVMRTPGHTLSSVSVIVRNTQLGNTVGIVGDLFERVDDIDDPTIWRNVGTEHDSYQRIERLRVIEMCDYIIPGHGAGFSVTDEMRSKLREQASDCGDDVKL